MNFFTRKNPKSETGDKRLDTILAYFDRREEDSDRSTDLHREWIRSEVGSADLVYLTQHYDQLPPDRQSEVPSELARTGSATVVPLLEKALKTPGNSSAFSGIYSAAFFGPIEEGYGPPLAHLTLASLRSGDIEPEKAFEILPKLDAALAAETLFSKEWLIPDGPHTSEILRACNQAEILVPLDLLSTLLEPGNPAGDFDRTRNIQLQAIVSLARHQPAESLQRIGLWIARYPDYADDAEAVALTAAGLENLYDSMIEPASSPEGLSSFPAVARQFFAIRTYLDSCDNGGECEAFESAVEWLPDLLEGFQAIGDPISYRCVREISDLFGPEGPSADPSVREEQIEEMDPPFDEQVDEITDVIYEVDKDEADKAPRIPSRLLLARYAAQHADALRALIRQR